MSKHTEWLAERGDTARFQMIGGLPYHTRYFYDTPIISPPPHMAGQRVYRDFVLEDSQHSSSCKALIKEDHSYAYIDYFSDPTEKYHYFK